MNTAVQEPVGKVVTKMDLIDHSPAFTWDLSQVAQYLHDHDNLDTLEIQGMEREYRKFIYLISRPEEGAQRMPISNKVDPFWHAHILFTRDYTAFSNALAGQYIHHTPTVGDRERSLLGDLYSTVTIPALEKTFGSVDRTWWPEASQVCQSSCHGGAGGEDRR